MVQLRYFANGLVQPPTNGFGYISLFLRSKSDHAELTFFAADLTADALMTDVPT